MDKVQKIREEVVRMHNLLPIIDGDNISVNYADRICTTLEMYIDSMQDEPVKIKKGCKYRCLSDMINKDTGNISFIGDKIYLAPEDDTLVSEENGWRCDTSENASNFELVEEPVSEDLEYASEKYSCRFSSSKYGYNKIKSAFKAGAERGKKAMKAQMLKELPKWKYKNDNIPLLRDSIILNKYGCVAKSPSGALVDDVWVLDYDELAKLPKEEQQ